jgi:hypothetical protein
MSIQKKSLISTLKTAKKANVATTNSAEIDAKGSKISSMRPAVQLKSVVHGKAAIQAKSAASLRAVNLKSMRASHSKSLNAKSAVSTRRMS